MNPNEHLECFWISFPRDPNLVLGIGVTAFSEEDAFNIIKERGLDEWYRDASEIRVRAGIRIEDLDPTNIVPNIGPMQLRGVWYPALNVGYGAPKYTAYKVFGKDDD
jgi:hypothetical protein